MWLCLSDAFFSVVEPDDVGGDVLLVRARRKGDIEKVFKGHEVKRTPGRDYLYRALIPREAVAQVLADQVRQISYDNFKNSVKENKLHGAFARFWHIHADLQEIPPYSRDRNKQGKLL